jgi:hypothetical protein
MMDALLISLEEHSFLKFLSFNFFALLYPLDRGIFRKHYDTQDSPSRVSARFLFYATKGPGWLSKGVKDQPATTGGCYDESC